MNAIIEREAMDCRITERLGQGVTGPVLRVSVLAVPSHPETPQTAQNGAQALLGRNSRDGGPDVRAKQSGMGL